MTQPTAANSGNSASSGAASPSAGNGLTDLLNEFDRPPGGTSATKTTDPTLERLKPVIDFATGEMQAKRFESIKKDVDSAMTFMAEAPELKEVPKRVIRGLMEGWGAENAALKEAFENREADPAAFKKVLEDCRAAIIEDWKGLPGNKVRSDVEAAVAAVRGTSTSPTSAGLPTNAEMWHVSAADFAKLRDREAAKARS